MSNDKPKVTQRHPCVRDGAVAMVITSTERARDLQQTPILKKGAVRGALNEPRLMPAFYSDSLTNLPETGLVARQLYIMTDVTVEDMQTGYSLLLIIPAKAEIQ